MTRDQLDALREVLQDTSTIGEDLLAHIDEQQRKIEKLRDALHRISLGAQNSGTIKEALGKEARAALKEV